MDWKHIFSNTQALLVENKMKANPQFIHKEESENIKIHCKAWGVYPLREIKGEIPKGCKRMDKTRMFLSLPQHGIKGDFFRLSLLSPSEQDILFACFSLFGVTLLFWWILPYIYLVVQNPVKTFSHVPLPPSAWHKDSSVRFLHKGFYLREQLLPHCTFFKQQLCKAGLIILFSYLCFDVKH